MLALPPGGLGFLLALQGLYFYNMKKPVVSIRSSEPVSAKKKRCYVIQVHLHHSPEPSFRLAVLSDQEREKLKEAMRRMQIASAPRLKKFYIIPQPPIFDDVDKLIADIVAVEDESGKEPQ